MARFITTKADFTLRRKHKTASGMTVYENDYTTINPMPNAFKNEYVIGDSNFKFTTRYGVNGQRKHTRGRFIPNPTGEASAWTMDTLINSAITPETKIKLKPNYTSIRDFACYGSAEKLIQGTINGVIADFPAELYFSEDKLALYKGDVEGTYSFDNTKELAATENIIYNEYDIDIISTNVREEDAYNPMRFFALCGTSYNFLSEGNEYEIISFTPNPMASGSCVDGTPVEVEKINEVKITFRTSATQTRTIEINVYKDYVSNRLYWTAKSGEPGSCIRPKKEVIETYFNNLDDFTAVLLNRETNPLYRAVFETPRETDTGIYYDMVPYVWPTLHGGFNPDLSDGYYAYVESLVNLSQFYDEYFTDNMWRSLTHEAIKTLDWTYLATTGDDTEDMSTIDTSRIEPITKIYGRQFDDLKRYADGIKAMNTITYNQKSNMPDYTLTDALSNSGWETKVLNITSDKDIRTEPLYSGLSMGYTSSDANTDFLRRLKLNSQYLFSAKGTRKSLDTLLALLGFTPDEYKIHEYVQVANPGDYGEYPHFCNDTSGKTFAYPLAKDVATINKYKINFNPNDPYGDYCGIPVAEIGFLSAGTDYSYVVPWYSQNKKYDDGLYFQMAGGWGNRDTKDIELDIAPEISFITNESGVSIYDETQTRLKFANDFDELLQQAYVSAITNDVCYVTDISDITDRYQFKAQEEPQTGLSHYFVLEDAELNQMLGFSASLEKYGWRNIKESEITENSTSAGTLVLYLESLKEDTTGNNPHVGNGLYDNGQGYIDSMSDIFGYSLNNNNFIGLTNEQCGDIFPYKFSMDAFEDNRKCWFFSDDYNHKLSKNENEQTFLEVDITDDVCNVKAYSGDVAYILSAYGGDNAAPMVGEGAPSSFINDSETTYNRISTLQAFNPEKPGEELAGEAAANSVVNVKNMTIDFKPVILEGMDPEAMKKYIDKTVIPYLTQMLPSTTILTWSFDGSNITEDTVSGHSLSLVVTSINGEGGGGGSAGEVAIPQQRDKTSEVEQIDSLNRTWLFSNAVWTDESKTAVTATSHKASNEKYPKSGYAISPTLSELCGGNIPANKLKITLNNLGYTGSVRVYVEAVDGNASTTHTTIDFLDASPNQASKWNFYIVGATNSTRIRFYTDSSVSSNVNANFRPLSITVGTDITVTECEPGMKYLHYYDASCNAIFFPGDYEGLYKYPIKTNGNYQTAMGKVFYNLGNAIRIGKNTTGRRKYDYLTIQGIDYHGENDDNPLRPLNYITSINIWQEPLSSDSGGGGEIPTTGITSSGTMTMEARYFSKWTSGRETYVNVTQSAFWSVEADHDGVITMTGKGTFSWKNESRSHVKVTVTAVYKNGEEEYEETYSFTIPPNKT